MAFKDWVPSYKQKLQDKFMALWKYVDSAESSSPEIILFRKKDGDRKIVKWPLGKA